MGWQDDFVQKGFESIGKDFGKDTKAHITKAYGSILAQRFKASDFRNESDISGVQFFEDHVSLVEILNRIEDVILNYLPILLVKKRGESIQVGRFVGGPC